MVPLNAGDPSSPLGLDVVVYFDYAYQAETQDWEACFKEASAQLWRATGKVYIKRVRLTSAPQMRDGADFRVSAGKGRCYADGGIPGFGQRGSQVIMFQETRTEAKTVVHELGHHLLGLRDEYKGTKFYIQAPGIWIPQTIYVVDPFLDQEAGDAALNGWYCDSATGADACLMDASTLWKGTRTAFCSAANHVPMSSRDKYYYFTDQVNFHHHPCWQDVAGILHMDTPAQAPVVTNGPPETTLVVTVSLGVTMVVMDASIYDAGAFKDAMNASRSYLTRQFGGGEVDGIILYSGLANRWMNIHVIDTQHFDLVTKIMAPTFVSQVTPTAALGPALDLAGQMINEAETKQGFAFASKTILLYSGNPNLSGPAPALFSQALLNADIHVEAFAVGPNADTAMLGDLARRTNGNFSSTFTLKSSASKSDTPQLTARVNGLQSIVHTQGTVPAGATPSQAVDVDTLMDEVRFDLSYDPASGPLALALVDPAGRSVDLSGADPRVVYRTLAATGTAVVSVKTPASGRWTIVMDGSGTKVPTGFSFDALAHGAGANVSITVDPSTAFPHPLYIRATLTAGSRIAGAVLTAVVSGPDGAEVTVPLSDDGAQTSGDLLPNDGEYSGYLTTFTASGTYLVRVVGSNQTGTYATYMLNAAPTGAVVTGQAPAFQRQATTRVSVTGVPSGGGRALLPVGMLSQTTTDPTRMTLSWTDTNQGRATYVVQAADNAPTTFRDLTVLKAGTTTFTDTLRGGDDRFYQVVARDPTLGDSLPSLVVEVNQKVIAAAFDGAGATPAASSSPLTTSGVLAGDGGGSGGGGGGGCFIATAAYGSYLDPHVKSLRDFRDNVLLTNTPGRAFVGLYYRVSPPLADWIARREWARCIARAGLTPLVLCVEQPWSMLTLAMLGAMAMQRQRRRRAAIVNLR